MSFLPPALKNLFSRGSSLNPEEPPAVEQEPAEVKDEPMGEQLVFDDEESRLISVQIEQDIEASKIQNAKRATRNAMYQNAWRDQLGAPGKADGTPNFEYPLIPIQILQKMATENHALFGEDANVTAVPTRPVDAERVAKAGAYMRWVTFNSMDIVWRWTVFSFRRLMFGRAFAILSYQKKYYDHPTLGRVCYQESPNFELVDADRVYTPGEDAESAQDFSFWAYKYYATPDELLLGEEESETYQGIKENWEEILRAAQDTSQRDTSGSAQEGVSQAKDRAAGVDVTNRAYQGKEFIEVFAWFGRWRMLAPPAVEDVSTEGLEKDYANSDVIPGEPLRAVEGRVMPNEIPVALTPNTLNPPRERRQTDLVIRWAPKLRGVGNLNGIIGAQKLAELYPDTPKKRPVFEQAFEQTGEYWGPGMAERLWPIKTELSVNENLATQGGQFSVGPFGSYKPASGMAPDMLKIQPGILFPTNNPKEEVNLFNLRYDPTFPQIKQQTMLTIVERLFGNLDASTGGQSGRTFGQRTAHGTMALLERGDLRVNFDTSFLLLGFGKLLRRLWDLCGMYAPPSQFFRVTGEDAEGLLKHEPKENQGFATMTAEEFGGEFDFELKPATGIHAKEAAKDDLLQAFALALQLPIIQMNANAMWKLARMALKPFGIAIEKIMPEPQPPEISIDPKEEWLAMLRGEEVHVTPADDDQKHLIRHNADFEKMADAPKEELDKDALFKLNEHVQEHLAQIAAKQQQQAQMAALLNHVTALAAAAHAGDAAGAKGKASKNGKKPAPAVPNVAGADPMMAETMGAQVGPMAPGGGM